MGGFLISRPSTPSPRAADAVTHGSQSESAVDRITDALRLAKGAGQPPAWEQREGGSKPQVNGNQVWARKIGAFTAVVTVDFFGRGHVRLEGPADCHAKATEFGAALLEQLTDGLPASVSRYLKAPPGEQSSQVFVEADTVSNGAAPGSTPHIVFGGAAKKPQDPGTVTLVELMTNKASAAATPSAVKEIAEKNASAEVVRDLFNAIDQVNEIGEGIAPNCYRVFTSDAYGADELVIAGSGIWWWNGKDEPHAPTREELANATIAGVTAALDEAADRVVAGVAKYFVDTQRVREGEFTRENVVSAFKDHAVWLTGLAQDVAKLRGQLERAQGTPKAADIERRFNESKDELFGELEMLRNSLDGASFRVTAWLDKNAV